MGFVFSRHIQTEWLREQWSLSKKSSLAALVLDSPRTIDQTEYFSTSNGMTIFFCRAFTATALVSHRSTIIILDGPQHDRH